MTQQLLQRESSSSRAPATAHTLDRRLASWVSKLLRNFGPQDWYITAYFTVMMLALAFGTGPQAERYDSMLRISADITWFVGGMVLTRGEIIKAGFFRQFAYRMAVWLSVFHSYFSLRYVLPAVSSRAIDADIYAFDMKVFHVEPAVAWDRFVSPTTTEWFAFFYFGYFFILIAHIIPIMLVSKDMKKLAHFAMGVFIVFCTGHLVYMLVPGYGPYRYLESTFQHELTGGTFWSWVQATVHAGGAQKDIFPSLHTAVPTYFTLFSIRYRKTAPFKYTWLFTAFCTSQIICATMFLRWHYLVDICAGITLAACGAYFGEKLAVWDEARRARSGGRHQPNFLRLDYASLFRQT